MATRVNRLPKEPIVITRQEKTSMVPSQKGSSTFFNISAVFLSSAPFRTPQLTAPWPSQVAVSLNGLSIRFELRRGSTFGWYSSVWMSRFKLKCSQSYLNSFLVIISNKKSIYRKNVQFVCRFKFVFQTCLRVH